jgi:hypothetical protein
MSRTQFKSSGTDSDPLHHSLYRVSRGTHSRTARRHRWHATKRLQPLGKTASVAINVTIEFGERHV